MTSSRVICGLGPPQSKILATPMAKAAVEHSMKWWLSRAGIPTNTLNQLITMVLKKHNNWTVLFKQRLKTTQLQLDKRKAFFGRNKENVLGAPTKL